VKVKERRGFWWENMKVRYSFEERVIFKCIFKQEDLILCSVLLWVRIETSGQLL